MKFGDGELYTMTGLEEKTELLHQVIETDSSFRVLMKTISTNPKCSLMVIYNLERRVGVNGEIKKVGCAIGSPVADLMDSVAGEAARIINEATAAVDKLVAEAEAA
jgi:hypothetical protein